MELKKMPGFCHIWYVDGLFAEYKKLFKDGKTYRDNINDLQRKLRILDTEKTQAVQHKSFEHLSNKPYFSLRQYTNANPRVLYYIVGVECQIILLKCFLENSSSAYRNACISADAILKELEA